MTRRATSRVLIVGQGYVGVPLAMRAVKVGHEVVGYENDDGRVKRLLSTETYVEDVPNEALAAAIGTGRYKPTTDPEECAGFDVAVVTVPTRCARGSRISPTSSPPPLPWPAICGPAPPSSWSPRRTAAPPTSWSARSLRKGRA